MIGAEQVIVYRFRYTDNSDLVSALLGMPLAALTSVPGIMIIVLIADLLWTMGVHGTVAVFH